VVRLLDAGRLDTGLPFLVTERLTGMNLAELLSACGPLTAATAVSYAQQLCAGLAAVHAGGIAHLDIKPTNLFLVARGCFASRLKILDFGIARRFRGARLTAPGSSSLMGSPSYSSPEQLDDLEAIDERSDVWSLGVVLFEMLTGTSPFAGTRFTSICTRVLLVPTPSLLGLRATLDHRLVAVVEACLEKRREHRFSSVQALAEALAPFGFGTAFRLVSPALGSDSRRLTDCSVKHLTQARRVERLRNRGFAG
jgi:eukaryotic-like serine/threonine-protein kinase